MLSNIGSLLDRLQGLFSRGFFIGGLIPLILLFLINWGLLSCFFPATYDAWSAYVVPPKENELMYWTKVVFILTTGAVVFWNLNPWLRQCMEGQFLLNGLYKWLRNKKRIRFNELSEERRKQSLELYDYRKNIPLWKKDLLNARRQGNLQNQAVDPQLIASFNQLKNNYQAAGTITFNEALQFKDQLKIELSKITANGNELNDMHEYFENLIDDIRRDLEYDFVRISAAIAQQFPVNYGLIGPTQMANLSNVHREYGVKQFGLDIEYFWQRLLRVIRNDKESFSMLEEAKTQLDFSVALTVILGLSTLLWIPLSFFAAGYWPWILVCLVGPLVTRIAYLVTVQSYRGFTEVVRSAIDLNRFELLKSLHLDLPANTDAEKELWEKVAEGKAPLIYKHP